MIGNLVLVLACACSSSVAYYTLDDSIEKFMHVRLEE